MILQCSHTKAGHRRQSYQSHRAIGRRWQNSANRIEGIYEKVKEEFDQSLIEEGENILIDLGLSPTQIDC